MEICPEKTLSRTRSAYVCELPCTLSKERVHDSRETNFSKCLSTKDAIKFSMLMYKGRRSQLVNLEAHAGLSKISKEETTVKTSFDRKNLSMKTVGLKTFPSLTC